MRINLYFLKLCPRTKYLLPFKLTGFFWEHPAIRLNPENYLYHQVWVNKYKRFLLHTEIWMSWNFILGSTWLTLKKLIWLQFSCHVKVNYCMVTLMSAVALKYSAVLLWCSSMWWHCHCTSIRSRNEDSGTQMWSALRWWFLWYLWWTEVSEFLHISILKAWCLFSFRYICITLARLTSGRQAFLIACSNTEHSSKLSCFFLLHQM